MVLFLNYKTASNQISASFFWKFFFFIFINSATKSSSSSDEETLSSFFSSLIFYFVSLFSWIFDALILNNYSDFNALARI